jgi:hypothetical protein
VFNAIIIASPAALSHLRRSTLTAVMPTPVKLKSPIKFLQEASADNEVIGKEVVEGGEGVLSVANSGNN